MLESSDVLFIFGRLLCGKAEVLHFLNLEYFSAKDLPNEGSLRDNHKVAVHFHFDNPIHGFDLHLLNISILTFLKLWLLDDL